MKLVRSVLLAAAIGASAPPALAGSAGGVLPQLTPGQSLGIALGIPSVPNLRDVGGYQTADGATVARGLAYRSDTFNPMSAEDIGKIERVGLKNDYGLRFQSVDATHASASVTVSNVPSNDRPILLHLWKSP
jgi:hypothetical protein